MEKYKSNIGQTVTLKHLYVSSIRATRFYFERITPPKMPVSKPMHHCEAAGFHFTSTKERRAIACRLKLQDGSFQSEQSLLIAATNAAISLLYNVGAHSAIMTNRCCHTVIAPPGSCAESDAELHLLNLSLWVLI